MPDVIVCVPFRSSDPHREAVFEFTRDRWEAFGFDVRVGGCDGDEWSCARARNAAAEGEWDVAVFADADIALANASQVHAAVERALLGGYVAPYSRLCWLAEPESARVLAGGPLRAEDAYHRVGSWLMTFVIGRVLWDQLDGFDEAYGPRDGEDVSFFHAARDLGGLGRVTGDAFHLYHPPREHRFFG